jgi:pimeloyl-ACP methyl ester carboxylesterase/DNA-binding CsgD family transcriptional regulator
MRPETRYARSGEVSIAYQVVGDGPLDLVLVSSWVTNVEENWHEPSYARLLSRLGSFARLIVFDKRGIGLSDRVAALPTLDERMDDVRAVMDAAGSTRAALLGSTEGGAICALFAATYPARTSALVMYGSYAKRLWAPDYPWGPTEDERARFYQTLTRQWGGPAILEYAAQSKLDDEHFCRWWAGYLRRSASPGAALALTMMNSEIDIRHVLGAIRVPTLILHRTGDPLCPVEGARYLAETIPGARLVELPGNDHLPFVGDVDAIVDAVQEFLTGARPAAEADRVLATVLFSEIVDPTGTAVRLGERRWEHALGAFLALVRLELARRRGTEIRTTGVGFLATFDGPARAIRCAVAIGGAARMLGLEVRNGLHAGEIDVLPTDVAGAAVDLAERVLARAGAGDVLVSSTVKDLVIGSGVAFDEIGLRLIVAPGESWRLFRVARPSAPAASDGTAPVPTNGRGDDPSRISRREREVAVLLARGLTNRQIAEDLAISVATVERHVANLFNKLGHRSRAQVAAWAVEHGLLLADPDQP